MAAILCESISKTLRASCEALGTVLTLPCRVCGCATEQITQLCASPFCLYLTVAVGLNLPPIIFAGMSAAAGDGGDGCPSAPNWLYVNAFLCLVNLAAAFYISAKIAHEPEEENAAPFVQAAVVGDGDNAKEQPEKTIVRKMFEDSLVNDSRSRTYDRVREILCYDPLVALYIIIGIFYVVWQTVGLSRARDCGAGLDEYLSYSLMCGSMFISIGGMAFVVSLCCLGLNR